MPQGIDEQMVLADVYAAALFSLAREKGTVAVVRAELDELDKLVAGDADLAEYLASPAVDEDERTAMLERVFRGKLSDDVLHALLVMNRNGRTGLVRPLHRAFVLRQQEDAGQVEVRVTSAVKLSPDQRTEVESVAAKVSGRKPIIEFVVDPTTIGGLILQIGDLRFDDSVTRHLERTRRQFVDRGDRGLNVSVED